MPDIGLFELLVIGVLLFVVVGPERMPEFFGQIGNWVRHGRHWWAQIRGEIGREINQNTAPFQHAAEDIHQQVDRVKQDVQRAVSEELQTDAHMNDHAGEIKASEQTPDVNRKSPPKHE